MAMVQWDQACVQAVEARAVRQTLRTKAPDDALAALRAADHRRLRALLVPMGHLHLQFREVPLLSDLFPAPK